MPSGIIDNKELHSKIKFFSSTAAQSFWSKSLCCWRPSITAILIVNLSKWSDRPAATTYFNTYCHWFVECDFANRLIITLYIANNFRRGFLSTFLTFQCLASSFWIINSAHNIISSKLTTIFFKNFALFGWILRN